MGILVGAFPCGVITLFDELYGSESLTQVYAIMIEYLACLPISTRQKLIEICYDDACHFKKYSENLSRADFSDLTKFMAGLGKHVDKFHFPNHVDPWCHKNCNPQDVRHLDGVNTPICEQLFSSINKFRNAKSMNESHFFLFFLYFFDLHNLNIERKLRSVANPNSEYRYDLIQDLNKDGETTTLEEIPNVQELNKEYETVDQVGDMFGKLTVAEETNSPKISELVCNLCGSKYKKVGNLNLHMKKKHQEVSIDPKCNVCGKTFDTEDELLKHKPQHYRCNECCIPFEDARSLNRHNKTYHSEVECGICNVACSDRSSYDVHMVEHLKCNICGKGFDKQHKLNRHAKTHK